MELFKLYPKEYYDGDEYFADFVENCSIDIPKKVIAEVVNQFIEWKQNVWAARWKKDFFKNGRCPECGSFNLTHYAVDWEGRESGWHICPSIWTIECQDCKTEFTCVSNDDGDLLTHWTTQPSCQSMSTKR
jgi:hypothetical protein